MRRLLLPLAVLCLALAAPAAVAAPPAPKIKVLSNRADLVSGGDALVQIVLPPGVNKNRMKISVGERIVNPAFDVRADGRFMGLVEGLANDPNVLEARVAGGGAARLKLLNHPIGGPVLAGPQIQPWTCFEGALAVGSSSLVSLGQAFRGV